jgi:hypothetical protein
MDDMELFEEDVLDPSIDDSGSDLDDSSSDDGSTLHYQVVRHFSSTGSCSKSYLIHFFSTMRPQSGSLTPLLGPLYLIEDEAKLLGPPP